MQQYNSNPIKRRAFALVLVLVLVFGGYSIRLFQIQIVDGEEYARAASKEDNITVPIQASRGEIVDRYLTPMAVNRTSFSIVFDSAFFPTSKSTEGQKLQNDIILSLAWLLTSEKCEWIDTLPISKTKPYKFSENGKSVSALKGKIGMADYSTAEQCMKEMVKRYLLSGYTDEEQRIAAGVRYEMETRQFSITNPYTFSNDVTEDTYNIILENSANYPGVNVQATPVREYVSKRVGAHLLGTVTSIYPGEYAELKSKGYKLNDTIGRSGIEQALESELRGTNGVNTVTKDTGGTVVEKKQTTPPIPGNTVVLTLDYGLQKKSQDEMNKAISELRSRPKNVKNNGHDVRSGSVVMLDVKSGGVLVSASWPDFDLSTYNKEYGKLINNKDKPLFNRALFGAFACGSTMKPGVALAGITEGLINKGSAPIACRTEYKYYKNLTLYCMGYHGHISVVDAIAKSCNVFFYDLGRRLGIDKMNEYSIHYGLGQKTGIEIGETEGVLAGKAHSKAVGKLWYPADNSTAAIGQSDNLFTPIQLASYAMTLANDGVRYKTHLVKSIRSYDGTEKVVEPEIASKAKLSKEAINAVRDGMVKAAKSGTASQFATAKYTVAAKTGTAQLVESRSDHGVFIAYAPAEKPEVAIAVVLENGTSRPTTNLAKAILDYYFASKSEGLAPTPQGVLLP